MSSWWKQGNPLLITVIGVGWQFLYVYFIAWGAALIMSFKPIFQKR